MKHKKEDISLVDLASALRIEEVFHEQEKEMNCGVHVVETGQSRKSKGKGKAKFQRNDKQYKFACWICGGPHMKQNCTKKRDNLE